MTNVTQKTSPCNPGNGLGQESSPNMLAQIAADLRSDVIQAAADGDSFDSVERMAWKALLEMGAQAMELFLSQQGTGDVGEEVSNEAGKTLQRSKTTRQTTIRSLFGTHQFAEFTYSVGTNCKIELAPVSARMSLPSNRWSYLLQEFSQMFCVDQAFGNASRNLGRVFGGKFSCDTLEGVNQKMGAAAGCFLAQVPTPDPAQEGSILVATADCKGVPLVKEDAAKVAAFETAKKRPGNRRMAAVASVYTIEPKHRTAEEVVAALFRDPQTQTTLGRQANKAPQPQHKITTAHLPSMFDPEDDQCAEMITAIHNSMGWMADQVHDRLTDSQAVMVVLMDGQQALWDAFDKHFPKEEKRVDILDLLHVAIYVWDAAKLLCAESGRKDFVRERMLKILQGGVVSVIRGLRRMGTMNLAGDQGAALMRICNYLEKNKSRMKYDEYLAAGYPIASGVIEGACRHLVKDRMERSGMRWTLEGARQMLNVRAAFQSDYWDDFLNRRIETQNEICHPLREKLKNYQPNILAV